MDGTFLRWAQAEITRLRDEADGLQRVVDRFLAAHGNGPVANQRPAVPAASSVRSEVPLLERRTKNAPILDAIDAAGPDGLTLDQIERAARDAGLTISRDNIRSFLFNAKRMGRIVALGVGRFAARETVRDHASEAPRTVSDATHGSSVEPAAGGGT